jgi:hypothetical protein
MKLNPLERELEDMEVQILNEKDYKSAKVQGRPRPIEYVINNECWECISHTSNRLGYPHIWRHGKQLRMNRYVYELYKNEIPKGHIVRHTCDNPKCINPDHLLTGTHQENTYDMLSRNRKPIGELVVNSKLTEKEVIEIFFDTRPKLKIANDYNVSKRTIQFIKQRKTWKHVTDNLIDSTNS